MPTIKTMKIRHRVANSMESENLLIILLKYLSILDYVDLSN